MSYVLILIAVTTGITFVPTEYVNKDKCEEAGKEFLKLRPIAVNYSCIPSGNNP